LGHEEYEREAARLAGLSRAERFEELIQFPTRHMIKAIGRRGQVELEIQRALQDLGFGDTIPVERHSAKGRFVSITVELSVQSGAQLDEIYTVLERLPALKYLF